MKLQPQYAIWLVLLLLSGCASMTILDTNNKRLLAAEISLQELSLFALNSKDRMPTKTRAEVKGLINDSHTALVAARIALGLGDELDFSTHLNAANSLIGVLRPILLELENQ